MRADYGGSFPGMDDVSIPGMDAATMQALVNPGKFQYRMTDPPVPRGAPGTVPGPINAPAPPANTSPMRNAPQTAGGSPSLPGTQAPSTTQQWNAGAVNWQNPTQQDIAAYGKSRGVENFDPGGYWMGKWNELNERGKQIGDPNYARMRLSLADEFTPVSQRYAGSPNDLQHQRDMAGAGGGGQVGGVVRGSSGANADIQKKLFDLLLGRATQSLDVNAKNDPAIRAQSDAYSANIERQRQRYLGDVAEQKGPYGSASQEARMSAESAGQQIAGHEATLVGSEIAARRQEIQQALSGAAGLLTQEQQLALQKELSVMDDATRRLGLNQQREQSMNELGFKSQQDKEYWDALQRGLING